jgi:hypothetical protein
MPAWMPSTPAKAKTPVSGLASRRCTSVAALLRCKARPEAVVSRAAAECRRSGEKHGACQMSLGHVILPRGLAPLLAAAVFSKVLRS